MPSASRVAASPSRVILGMRFEQVEHAVGHCDAKRIAAVRSAGERLPIRARAPPSRLAARRTPQSAAPPPMIFPSAVRSGVTPSRPCAPCKPNRSHVMTSSKISSAPQRRARSRKPSRKPAAGGTKPMFAADRLDDDRGQLGLAPLRQLVDRREIVVARDHDVAPYRPREFRRRPRIAPKRPRRAARDRSVRDSSRQTSSTSRRLVNARATRIALIIASVPVVTNRMRSIDGRYARMRSARRISSACVVPQTNPCGRARPSRRSAPDACGRRATGRTP